MITKAREIDFHVIMKNSDATSMRNRSGIYQELNRGNTIDTKQMKKFESRHNPLTRHEMGIAVEI